MTAPTPRREEPRLHHPPEPVLATTAAPGRAARARRRLRGTTPDATTHRAGRGALPLVALVPLFALAGCEPFVQGDGVYREDPRQVAAFEGVSVHDAIQIQITAGAAQAVTITGDENVVQHIQTSVRADPLQGAVLDVQSTVRSFDSVNPIRAVISVPSLHYIAAVRAAPVTASAVAAPAFTVEASDGATVQLGGAGGGSITVQLSGGEHGGARLGAQAYPVDTASVALSGGARADLAARLDVTGTATGASTVDNAGTATCEVTASADSTVSCHPAP